MLFITAKKKKKKKKKDRTAWYCKERSNQQDNDQQSRMPGRQHGIKRLYTRERFWKIHSTFIIITGVNWKCCLVFKMYCGRIHIGWYISRINSSIIFKWTIIISITVHTSDLIYVVTSVFMIIFRPTHPTTPQQVEHPDGKSWSVFLFALPKKRQMPSCSIRTEYLEKAVE